MYEHEGDFMSSKSWMIAVFCTVAILGTTNFVSGNDFFEPKKTVLKVGYIEFPPVFFTNEDGEPEGNLITLASKVLPKAGYDWAASSYPTKRMVKMIITGELDLWIGLATLPPFKNTTYVGESTVATIELNAYRIGDKEDIHTKEDLIDKDIIIMRGYSYGGWVDFIKDPKNNINHIEINAHKQGLLMLYADRADYFLDYTGPINNELKSIEIPYLASNRISALEARFVVSKKTKDGKKVLKNLESAYKALVSEGVLEPSE